MSARGVRKRIICVGHAALDGVFAVESWPAHSGKIEAHGFTQSGGGMAANAAAAIARLGGEAVFWGPTGEDPLADAIAASLIAEGVDVRGLRRFEGRTSSHSAVMIDKRGERLVVGYRGSALQASADWLPLEQIGRAAAVLADVRWADGALRSLRAARAAGIPAVLDAEIAPVQTLDMLAAAASHVIFSERGLEAWCGHDTPAALSGVLERGALMAAVTRGAAGVDWIEAMSPGKQLHCPAFPVATVDTLGAGDVFHGAYTLALAEGRLIGEAIRFAAAAAAIKCSRPGGRSGAPTRDEVDTLLHTAGKPHS
ncbi:MAG: PfkB family carbohydrate kinase [Burkholderiales bacterium]|jgi:sulfofructose kinase